MTNYAQNLHALLSVHRNPEHQKPMEAYLKNKFVLFGIKSPQRKELLKKFIQINGKLTPENAHQIITDCWKAAEREMHYCALELLVPYLKKHAVESDIQLITQLITQHSWWDSVDGLAVNAAGTYFKKFPEQIPNICANWMNSGNIWLQRSCLLFQLKYKENTNTILLESFIERLKISKEFFIRKAIGWALREYAKTNPNYVRQFLKQNTLSPLSTKEALKNII